MDEGDRWFFAGIALLVAFTVALAAGAPWVAAVLGIAAIPCTIIGYAKR